MSHKELESKIDQILRLVSHIPDIKASLETIEKDVAEILCTLDSSKEEAC